MEVHQLRYFCAIAKYGTFTRAAREEYVSQPSLSQQIIKLEDELGGKLFDRLPRIARLTALGETFLPRALAVLQEIRDSKAEAQKVVALQKSGPSLNTISSSTVPLTPVSPTPPVPPASSLAHALPKIA